MELKTKDYIFLSIIICLLLVCFFKKSSVKTITTEIENTHKIDSLQRLNVAKQDSINELSIYIDTLNAYNDRLKQSYNKNILEIKRIKNAAHKKDSTVNLYNVNELELFFSKRYDSTTR